MRVAFVSGVVFGLIVLLSGLGFSHHYSAKAREQQARKLAVVAEPIVSALEVYKSEHGSYPKKLADLSSVGLQEIPNPDWGDKAWDYSSNSENFLISVVRMGPFKMEEIFKENDSNWHTQ